MQEKLRMVQDYKEKPDQTKKYIKYWSLKSFDNNLDNFPAIAVTNINKIFENENYTFMQQLPLYEKHKHLYVI